MDVMIAALLRPEAYGHPVGRIVLLETHISWILLTGTYAYKIKKPVNLGFVDFSTLERRRWFCGEEIRLNRRLAPDLYLDVCPIHGPPAAARLLGSGALIDYAVRMRQFDQADLLPAVLERDGLQPAMVAELADRLAHFHAGAAVVGAADPYGTPAQVLAPVRENFQALEDRAVAFSALPLLRDWSEREFAALVPLFTARRSAGRLRECHGDLHLGNMVLRGGVVEVFDCLEFSPSLRWIDVISDLAFLVMDLGQRGRADLGCQLLDQWLARCGDYQGLRLWRWYVVYRAVVRAKVSALQFRQGDDPLKAGLRHDFESYLQLARDLGARGGPSPCGSTPLLITHGVSGSGKSHLSGALARHRGWIRLRSDAERKRRFGRWGESLDPPRRGDPYSPEVSAWLYGEHLPSCAEAVIRAGFGVIVDATFLGRDQRRLFEQLAERLGVGFAILDCRVTPELARRRIAQRQRRGLDPSDGDAAVLAAQLARIEELTPAELSRALVFQPGGEFGIEGSALERLARALEALLKPRAGQP